MALNGKKRMFPCPVYTEPREVRETKKAKPYLVCDPCGVQVFVRGPGGIGEFNRLLQGRITMAFWHGSKRWSGGIA